MLSFSSILAFFSQIALAGIGLLGIFCFIKRFQQNPNKRFFYALIITSFSIATLQGLSSFATSLLYILRGPETALNPWKYILVTTPLLIWIHWTTLLFIFTQRKRSWHRWILAPLFVISSIIFTVTPISVFNNHGIITPQGLNWQTLLFGLESLSLQILLLIYIICHRSRLIKQNKPTGYINLIALTFACLTVVYLTASLYIITNYPPLFLASWTGAATAMIFYFLGLIAIDDENEILLIKPFLYIQRSLRFKMALIINTLVWVILVSIIIFNTSLINKTLGPYQDTPVIKRMLTDAVRAQAWFLIISIFILMITSFLIIYFINTLLRPIEHLKKGTKIIGSGNLDYRITRIPKDELGRLMTDFNEMTTKLQKESKEIVYLKELDEMKSQFLSIASHQLRTPLTAMRWSLSSFLNKKGSKKSSEEKNFFLQTTYNSTLRLIRLVNDLLDASKLQIRQVTIKKTNISLTKIIKEILDEIPGYIQEKKVKIKMISTGRKPFLIKGDEKMITMAIENLIVNAIDYSKTEGEIIIKLKKKDDDFLINVTDNGLGIKKEEAKNIFSPFYRSPEALKVKTAGSGLGLYITKSIVQAHGGKIWFKSKEGKGTSFYLSLPK